MITFKKFGLVPYIATAFLAASATEASAQGNSSNANGQPFDALQQQIDALQSQVDNLTAAISLEPIEMYVDCSAGDTVNGAISSAGGLPNSLIITISGTCSESVIITRSNITLVGENPSDGISGFYSVLASRGASHIEVESMTLGGGSIGLGCFSGATVTARNVNIVNSNTGVMALHGGNCDISDSTIIDNSTGLIVGNGSQVWLRGVDVTNSVASVTNSDTGAIVHTSSNLNLDRSPTDSSPTTISKFYRGFQIVSNGSVELSQAIIEGNTADGIFVSSGGSVFVTSSANVAIRNNGRHGISIGNLANAILSGVVNISNNDGFGLECIGTYAISYAGNSPTYSGNGFGPIRSDCNIAP